MNPISIEEDNSELFCFIDIVGVTDSKLNKMIKELNMTETYKQTSYHNLHLVCL